MRRIIAWLITRRVTEWLLCLVFPYRDIPAPDGRLYLRRWFLRPRRAGFWSATDTERWCLHKICLSDEDRDPHTHPSGFTTLILAGGYAEQRFYRDPFRGRLPIGWRVLDAGAAVDNPPGHIHRVVLIDGKPAWTLVRMDASQGEWGFVAADGTVIHPDVYRGRNVLRLTS